jgi:AMMECR1 domain-containing protein
MVLLRRDGRARLWRSARGSSIARALVTAAVVARKRWTEREQAMGGPIDDVLAGIEVEVSLLADDGTIGDPTEAFVDRVIAAEHGVAYERKGAWRYLLPEATHEHPRPFEAYLALLAEEGLEADALASPEVRPYRLAVEVLARSPAAR